MLYQGKIYLSFQSLILILATKVNDLKEYVVINIFVQNDFFLLTDFPIDCDDAKFNNLYKVKEDGPQIIDIDGPDGPTNPVLVHCDMESYPHVGITVIPHDK